MDKEREHQPWDDSLSGLVRANPEAFIALVLGKARFKRQLPRRLKTWKQEVDALLLVVVQDEHGEGEEQEMLVHVELQTYNDYTMRERLLRYHVAIRSEYELPVLSCVIYLLKDGTIQPSPLQWTIPTGQEMLTFHFESIELGERSPEELLQLDQPGLLPLLPLTKGGAKREIVTTMFAGLQATGSKDLLDIGGVLASLVFKRENPAELEWLQRSLRQMHDILREAPFYQEILQEGREEGREKGLEEGLEKGYEKGFIEGLRQTLVNFVQARFPSPKMIRLAKGQASLINDPRVLQDLTLKVGLAQTAEEAQNYLLDWPDTGQMDNEVEGGK